jgi:hypothetical protein
VDINGLVSEAPAKEVEPPAVAVAPKVNLFKETARAGLDMVKGWRETDADAAAHASHTGTPGSRPGSRAGTPGSGAGSRGGTPGRGRHKFNDHVHQRRRKGLAFSSRERPVWIPSMGVKTTFSTEEARLNVISQRQLHMVRRSTLNHCPRPPRAVKRPH